MALCQHLGFPTSAWDRHTDDAGRTRSLAHYEFETEHRHYVLIDLPGRARYRKSLRKGLGMLDGVIVMLSDNYTSFDGITELFLYFTHFSIPIVSLVNQHGDPSQTIGISGVDVHECFIPPVDHPRQFADIACHIPFSDLLQSIDQLSAVPPRDSKPFLLPISEIYPVTNVGTVITGKVKQGSIRLGDEVEIAGQRESKITTITGIEMCYKTLDTARAGDQVSLQLRGFDTKELRIGQLAAAPGSLKLGTKFRARFQRAGALETPFLRLEQNCQIQCLFHGRALSGSFAETVIQATGYPFGRYWNDLAEDEVIEVDIELMHPTHLEKAARFILLFDAQMIAGGEVIEIK